MNPILTYIRQLFIIACLLMIACCIQAQPSEPLSHRYPVMQKRLLAITTGQYLFAINQGQLDADSAMLFGCGMFGYSRLLPYNEAYYQIGQSKAALFIDANKPAMAVALVHQLKAQELARLLAELSAYYLSRPGNIKGDLDSAFYFMKQGEAVAKAGRWPVWQGEFFRLMGKYYTCTGNMAAAGNSFAQAEKVAEASGDQPGMALTWENRAQYTPFGHPDKLSYLQKSLALYRKLQLREKEIEVLSEIVSVHFRSDFAAAEKELEQMLAIESAIGYKHSIYTHDVLAFLTQVKGSVITAFHHTDMALKCVQATGDTVLYPFVYMRRGAIYGLLKKNAEAIDAFYMVINQRYRLPYIFWYKNFLSLVSFLGYLDRATEALVLIDSVTREFPPVTMFDKMQVTLLRGQCYQQLHRIKEADEQITAFAAMADKFPPEHAYVDLPGSYLSIANFYLSIKQPDKAYLFLAKASRSPHMKNSVANMANLSLLEFRLDTMGGKYQSALKHYIDYKRYDDSMSSLSQRKQMDELVVKYATEKKEKDIVLLRQQGKLQQAQIKQGNLVRNVTLAGIVLLLIITGLLYNRYRLKQRSSQQVQLKNQALQHLLDEKEWLVKEIHHRVKNNLQTIVSLLESQSAYVKDDALLVLQDSQNRVYAMSLIHQKLYQSDNMTAINMVTYVPELIAHLKDSFKAGEVIAFSLDIAPVEMDVTQAIPLGLILNEAITNAIKYAFSESMTPKQIHISVRQLSENKMEMTIQDNGRGLPPDFDASRSNSLGMRLMRGLTEDIEGVFTLTSNNGTRISVLFTANTVLYGAHYTA